MTNLKVEKGLYMSKKGVLFIVSAPSGAGKTTLCKMMLDKYPKLVNSVSYTTRLPRTIEREGVDYNFIDVERFKSMISNNQFLEWATVHNNYYGTSLNFINEKINAGFDIILDIDPQGAIQIKEHYQGDAVYIFITAPSFKVLKERLIKRATDDISAIETRMQTARKELVYFDRYDYLIVNDDSDRAFFELDSIYRSEKLRTKHIKCIEDFMDTLGEQ